MRTPSSCPGIVFQLFIQKLGTGKEQSYVCMCVYSKNAALLREQSSLKHLHSMSLAMQFSGASMSIMAAANMSSSSSLSLWPSRQCLEGR